MGQYENLRAHPEYKAAHDSSRETQDLFLAGCANRGKRSQQARGHRRANAWPGDGIVDDITGGRSEAALQREFVVLRVDEPARGEPLWPGYVVRRRQVLIYRSRI